MWWNPLNYLRPVRPALARPYRIGLSPGHGGEDPGAISTLGQHEAQLARRVSRYMHSGFTTHLWCSPTIYGQDEVKKDYTQRVKDSDSNRDDFYIPVHFNASTSSRANGWTVILDPQDVKQKPLLLGLAATILKELQGVAQLGYADFDIKHDGVMTEVYKPIYELTKPKALTAYLELGFVSNDEWARRLGSEDILHSMADAVVRAFNQYLQVVELRIW